MTEILTPYIITTPEEVKAVEGEGVMLIQAYNPRFPAYVIRGTGREDSSEAWEDIEHKSYLYFDSDQVMLPALVFFIPEKVEETVTPELKQSGYVLAVEDHSLSASQVPNWINPEYLNDVTDSEDESIHDIVKVAQGTGYLGNRLYLISDPQVVADWTEHGLYVFRSKTGSDSTDSAFLILSGLQSEKARKELEDFTANHGLKGRITPESLDEDDTWKGRK